MHSACPHRPTPSRAPGVCGSLLLLLVSLLLTTSAVARDSTGNKADTSSKISTPEIDFVGNRAFTSDKLREVLSKVHPRWFTESGTIVPNALRSAIDYLSAFYYDHGFLESQVDQPEIASANRATIAIYEGRLYRLGSIAIEGGLKLPRRDVESQLTIHSGQPFRSTILQHNVFALSDFYSDRGFAYVNIDPRTKMDSDRHLVDARFLIKPGNQIRIDQITITENTKTPEQVIRAALQFHEHQLYSARAFHESKAHLDKLGLESQITTEPSPNSDEINVKVTIVEKSQ